MTKYESLVEKANKCLNCARKAKGLMRSIWLSHYYALKAKAGKLTLEEAQETV